MISWPTDLPQFPLIDFSDALNSGLNSPDEAINPLRTRTYPEREAEYTFMMTTAQWQALRTFYAVTLNESAPFTAPWLVPLGYGFHYLRFTAPPKAKGQGLWREVTIGVEIVAGVPVVGGSPAVWAPTGIGSAPSGARSVVFDLVNNYGFSSRMGLRSVEFKLGGVLIPLAEADFTAYATTAYQSPKNAFITSQSKTGTYVGNEWVSSSASGSQRLIIVFNGYQDLGGITINNGHTSGANTSWGVRYVKISASTDEITDTTYDAPIGSETVLFNGEFAEHVASDVEDDQDLVLLI